LLIAVGVTDGVKVLIGVNVGAGTAWVKFAADSNAAAATAQISKEHTNLFRETDGFMWGHSFSY
jgi:hypothetical protein